MISPLAYVDSSARLGANVVVHPFAYIGKDVEIGDNCEIMPHASVLEGTRMGKGNVVCQNAVLGVDPQDFHYRKGDKTYLQIGDNNRFRENVVVSRGTKPGSATVIGNDNFFMDKVHLCHDVKVHDKCVLGIGVTVAGECEIEDCAIVSTNAILNQRCRMGYCSMVQSGSRISKDIPPFVIISGNPAEYHGVNSIIMSHLDISDRVMRHIVNVYRLIYSTNCSLEDSVHRIKDQIPMSQEIDIIIDFIKKSSLGLVGAGSLADK